MLKQFYRMMEGEPEAVGGTGSILTDTPPADGGTPPADGGGDPAPNPLKELYGDISDKIEWPDGFTDDIKTSPSLKPFVGQDGKINYANMAKSYLHTKQLVGNNKAVMLPDENSTEEQKAEFYEKLGFVKDAAQYKVELPEGSKVSPEFADSLKQVLHKNYVPPKVANELVKFLDEQTKNAEEVQKTAFTKTVTENVEAIKKEFGSAFNERIGMANKLIQEMAGDDQSILEAFKDPAIGSHPAVVKLLAKVAAEAYSEDSSVGTGKSASGRLSPAEATQEMNRIYGDKSDAFHNRSHPSYQDRQKHMLELARMKNGQ